MGSSKKGTNIGNRQMVSLEGWLCAPEIEGNQSHRTVGIISKKIKYPMYLKVSRENFNNWGTIWGWICDKYLEH